MDTESFAESKGVVLKDYKTITLINAVTEIKCIAVAMGKLNGPI